MSKRRAKTPRRWWQRTARAAVLVALILLGAYVTLPWWLPAGLLGDWLTGTMSGQMGVKVTVDDVSVSWSDGVTLRQLVIHSAAGEGEQPIATVDTLRAEFSPVNFLRGRIGWMALQKPKLFVRPEGDGRVNVRRLGDMVFEAEPDRITVQGGELFVTLTPTAPASTRPGAAEHTLHADIQDLQFVAGRSARLGRLTMSAAVRQKDAAPAPLSLTVTAGTGERSVAAAASLTFTNLRLGKFAIAEMLDLPLRELNGRCSGGLSLQVNREGFVDRIGLDVAIRRLDVQPIEGPTLPIIERAGLRVAAAFDPLTGRIELQSARAHLPGLDVSGQATMGGDIATGNWEAIESIELAGDIRPAPLAAVLTGSADLPGRMEIDGPIAMAFSARRDGAQLIAHLRADATSTALRCAGKTIKPSGRTLRVDLGGSLDRRNWRFNAEQTELLLGGNRFVGWGTLGNLRELIARAAEAESPDPKWLVGELSNLDWQGAWELTEMKSLGDLYAPLGAALSPVRLDGTLSGRWLVERRNGSRVTLTMKAPVGTTLSAGELVSKPADLPMSASLAATLDREQLALRDVDAELSAGEGWFAVNRGYVTFSPLAGEDDDEPVLSIEAGGRYNAERVEALGRCLAAAAEPPLRLAGGVRGTCRVQLAGDVLRTYADADLSDARVSAGQWFDKPVDAPAAVRVNFLHDASLPADRRNTLTFDAETAPLRVGGRIVLVAGDDQPGCRAHLRADVLDAAALAERSPVLGDALGDARVRGQSSLRLDASLAGREARFDVRWDADALSIVSADRRRRKDAGVPLRVRAGGTFACRQGGNRTVDLTALAVDLGASQLRARGNLAYYQGADVLPGDCSADVDARVVLDPALDALSPEIAALAERVGAEGMLSGNLHIAGSGGRMKLTGACDATKLGIRRIGPSVVPPADSPGLSDRERVVLGPFTKPADLPARAVFELTLPMGDEPAHLNHLSVRVGDCGVLAGGTIHPAHPGGGPPVGFHGQASVWTDNAATLVRLCPSLAPYELAGNAMVELGIRPGRAGEIPYLNANFSEFTAVVAGETVRLDGGVSLIDVRIPRDGPASVGRFSADPFEFRIGDNHGWVFADVADPLVAPAGTLRMRCEYLDEPALGDWAARLTGIPQASDGPPQPADVKAHAERLLADAVPVARRADLDVEMSVARLRTFDPLVEQVYHPEQLEMTARVTGGVARLEYATGLCGGMLWYDAEVNLTDPTPRVRYRRHLRNAVATDSIRPQLSRHFPGNTVFGSLTRHEQLQAPLRDLVANMLDWRVGVYPSGTARTIAIDGVVVGRAAPKFVTVIFPGLNLARYRYEKMTGFAELEPDGTVRNEMIFSGQTYDMYMEGATEPDGVAHYDIGVLLLGSVAEPETHRAWRQGRIPILKWRAKIEDGELVAETVTYPWPTETAFEVFLKNNFAYRAWLNARKK